MKRNGEVGCELMGWKGTTFCFDILKFWGCKIENCLDYNCPNCFRSLLHVVNIKDKSVIHKVHIHTENNKSVTRFIYVEWNEVSRKMDKWRVKSTQRYVERERASLELEISKFSSCSGKWCPYLFIHQGSLNTIYKSFLTISI